MTDRPRQSKDHVPVELGEIDCLIGSYMLSLSEALPERW